MRILRRTTVKQTCESRLASVCGKITKEIKELKIS